MAPGCDVFCQIYSSPVVAIGGIATGWLSAIGSRVVELPPTMIQSGPKAVAASPTFFVCPKRIACVPPTLIAPGFEGSAYIACRPIIATGLALLPAPLPAPGKAIVKPVATLTPVGPIDIGVLEMTLDCPWPKC